MIPPNPIITTKNAINTTNAINVGWISASASTEPTRVVRLSLVDALSLIHPTMNGALNTENGKLNVTRCSHLLTIHFQMIVGWAL